jgi:hypothetical protein
LGRGIGKGPGGKLSEFMEKQTDEGHKKAAARSEAKAAEVLSSYGVKWLLIDLRRPHAKDLSNIAIKAFSSGEVEVWKLNDFGTRINRPITGCLST